MFLQHHIYPWEFMGYAASDISLEIRQAWLIACEGIRIESEEHARNVGNRSNDDEE